MAAVAVAVAVAAVVVAVVVVVAVLAAPGWVRAPATARDSVPVMAQDWGRGSVPVRAQDWERGSVPAWAPALDHRCHRRPTGSAARRRTVR
ncbi:MAG: hypothetical protein LC129_01365 [Burkholderiales bacterium]|nr:hypothetical protein [Burkholderiales bacterium]